jgi:hypothetical protein
LVVGLPLGETGLEKGGGVQELGGLAFLVLIVTSSFGVVVFLFGIVAFTELGLKGLNFFLKVQLVRLVLLLESQDLVVGLLAYALTLVGRLVKFFDALHSGGDFALVALVDTGLVALLLAPNINFLTKVFVGRLEVVEFYEGLV